MKLLLKHYQSTIRIINRYWKLMTHWASPCRSADPPCKAPRFTTREVRFRAGKGVHWPSWCSQSFKHLPWGNCDHDPESESWWLWHHDSRGQQWHKLDSKHLQTFWSGGGFHWHLHNDGIVILNPGSWWGSKIILHTNGTPMTFWIYPHCLSVILVTNLKSTDIWICK